MSSTSMPTPKPEATANREIDEERQRLYYVALTRAKARLYLPFVPGPHMSDSWKGATAAVNDRLAAVLDLPEASNLFPARSAFATNRTEPRPATGRGRNPSRMASPAARISRNATIQPSSPVSASGIGPARSPPTPG